MSEPIAVHAMPGSADCAANLADLLEIPCVDVAVHYFPDGESLVNAGTLAKTAILYCSLDRPNSKLVNLALAAAALRDQGVGRLILVAPYLCYMRQDTAFHPGEAVSQRVIGPWLAQNFDRIVTVDPHLHRISDIAEALPGTEAHALSAAPLLAELIRHDEGAGDIVLVGPDSESRQWVEQIAVPLAVPALIGAKIRDGDRKVSIDIGDVEQVDGRTAYIVDDMVSSGMTLATCAERLIEAGARRVEVVVVHALCSADDLAMMEAAGVARLRSTDSVIHPTNAISLSPLLVDALISEKG
jgi:ribose-phosphate pyrophosphokinase